MKEETYKEYIERCRNFNTGFDVTNFTLDINGQKVGIELPERYLDMVDVISKAVNRKLKKGELEIDARGNVSKVLNALELKGVIALGEHFAKELSEKLYGGECFISHIHPYKNNMSDRGEAASWIWHYDNVAPGLIKILIYLTDTTKNTGAFLTLKNKDDEYPLIEPSKVSPTEGGNPKWAGSRIPEKVIQQYKRRGYKPFYVEGPKGTFILFNNNIVHKATIPTEEPERLCLIYHFRPYHTKMESHINDNITWDWKSKINSKTYDFDMIDKSNWKELREKLSSTNKTK